MSNGYAILSHILLLFERDEKKKRTTNIQDDKNRDSPHLPIFVVIVYCYFQLFPKNNKTL